MTDDYVKKIEDIFKAKEKVCLHVLFREFSINFQILMFPLLQELTTV